MMLSRTSRRIRVGKTLLERMILMGSTRKKSFTCATAKAIIHAIWMLLSDLSENRASHARQKSKYPARKNAPSLLCHFGLSSNSPSPMN